MKAAVFVLLALCVVGAWAQDEDAEDAPGYAHCLLHKEIVAENDYVVAEKEFTVTYTVFNTGTAAAYDVSIKENVPSDDFDIVEGAVEKFFDKIEAESEESFNVTLVPNKAGVWTPARAVVEYRDAEAGEDKKSQSSTLGSLQILTPADYERAVATYEREWITFVIMAAGPILIPFFVYQQASKDKSA